MCERCLSGRLGLTLQVPQTHPGLRLQEIRVHASAAKKGSKKRSASPIVASQAARARKVIDNVKRIDSWAPGEQRTQTRAAHSAPGPSQAL